jgi:hypothetical protein
MGNTTANTMGNTMAITDKIKTVTVNSCNLLCGLAVTMLDGNFRAGKAANVWTEMERFL